MRRRQVSSRGYCAIGLVYGGLGRIAADRSNLGSGASCAADRSRVLAGIFSGTERRKTLGSGRLLGLSHSLRRF